MQVKDVLVLHQSCPSGIDRKPYFSWKIESERRNVMQTAYRIRVHSQTQTCVWDSGKIVGSQDAYVPYGGESLESRKRYDCEITVWDDRDESATAKTYFDTAFFQESEWKAKWVVSGLPRKKSEKGFGNQDPATLFRKVFSCAGTPVRAKIYSTCHGIYKLFINRTQCKISEFAPEHTMYEKYLCYQTTDVTDLIMPGQNILSMYVGDGWMFGAQSRTCLPVLEDAHSILFQLEIEYEDGNTHTIVSDESVECAYGPVRSSDLFAGELYDANSSPSGWQGVRVCNYGYKNLRAQIGENVTAIMELPVKSVLRTPNGETVIDFGQILAGRVKMHVSEPKGTRITLEHSEVLDKDGNFFNNISGQQGVGDGVDQKDIFISDGTEQFYEPLFTFHGFRYVKVTGLQEIRMKDFTAIVLSSEQRNLCTFTSSDEKLNRLYQNTRWSQRSNMLSIPTDCPQRERAGWTGDIQIYAKTALQNADLTGFLTRWLENLECEQDDEGRVPIVVPYDGPYPALGSSLTRMFRQKGKLTSAGWSDAAILVPYQMYLVTGNQEILIQQYDSMKKWCNHVIRTAKEEKNPASMLPPEKEQYLWDTGFHWGEWLIPSMEMTADGKQKSMMTASDYISPIFGWNSVNRMAEIAGILGKNEDRNFYAGIAEKMKEAISYGIITEAGKMPVDFMGAYVLALYFDLVPQEHQKKFEKHLIRMIEENDGCLDTGFLGTPYILDTCCKIGRLDIAYSLLWQEKCPSWMYEVDNGATAIWESWFSYEDGNPRYTSMNHYAFGCVDDWIFRYIGGIIADEPGYKHITIYPQPDKRLTEAYLTLDTVHGKISSHWKKIENRGIFVKTDIPCNTKATLVLSDGKKEDVGSGHYEYWINQNHG